MKCLCIALRIARACFVEGCYVCYNKYISHLFKTTVISSLGETLPESLSVCLRWGETPLLSTLPSQERACHKPNLTPFEPFLLAHMYCYCLPPFQQCYFMLGLCYYIFKARRFASPAGLHLRIYRSLLIFCQLQFLVSCISCLIVIILDEQYSKI